MGIFQIHATSPPLVRFSLTPSLPWCRHHMYMASSMAKRRRQDYFRLHSISFPLFDRFDRPSSVRRLARPIHRGERGQRPSYADATASLCGSVSRRVSVCVESHRHKKILSNTAGHLLTAECWPEDGSFPHLYLMPNRHPTRDPAMW